MQGEPPEPAGTRMGVVFLSHASQDAEAAARICGALRAAGIEVWFDHSGVAVSAKSSSRMSPYGAPPPGASRAAAV